MVTDALEERLRLRLRLLLTWKIRAAELLRHPETCPVEEFPPNLASTGRAEWLRNQEQNARAAVNRTRETLIQRATRFNDLARTYAYRRDRLPEKAAEGQLNPTQANEASRQLLRAIEACTRRAALCTSLAETDSVESIGGPVKLRLHRYEAELGRFGSLDALLDALEQKNVQVEKPPNLGQDRSAAARPPDQKQS